MPTYKKWLFCIYNALNKARLLIYCNVVSINETYYFICMYNYTLFPFETTERHLLLPLQTIMSYFTWSLQIYSFNIN